MTVYNNPRNYEEALRVDFDFSDLSKREETYGCIVQQVGHRLAKVKVDQSL